MNHRAKSAFCDYKVAMAALFLFLVQMVFCHRGQRCLNCRGRSPVDSCETQKAGEATNGREVVD